VVSTKTSSLGTFLVDGKAARSISGMPTMAP
jgi:hypothetical protein